MADLTFVPSGRGGRKVIFQGFVYTMNRSTANGSTWHCTQRHSDCKGRIKINAQENGVQVIKRHSHLPDYGVVKAEKLMAAAKKRVIDEPNLLPALVSRETFSTADDDALVALPNENSVKRALQRLRRRGNPRLPSSLDDLENIPETYQSINGVRWLIQDMAENNHRSLMFGRPSAITAMSKSRMWYMDGTFKSRPLLFAQLYVLHYEYHGHVIPGV